MWCALRFKPYTDCVLHILRLLFIETAIASRALFSPRISESPPQESAHLPWSLSPILPPRRPLSTLGDLLTLTDDRWKRPIIVRQHFCSAARVRTPFFHVSQWHIPRTAAFGHPWCIVMIVRQRIVYYLYYGNTRSSSMTTTTTTTCISGLRTRLRRLIFFFFFCSFLLSYTR